MSPRQSERQAQGGAEAQGGQEAVGAVRWLDRPQADDELLGRSLLGFPVPPALPRGLPLRINETRRPTTRRLERLGTAPSFEKLPRPVKGALTWAFTRHRRSRGSSAVPMPS